MGSRRARVAGSRGPRGRGVSATRPSAGGFEAGNTFSGSGANVSCDDTSLASGEPAGAPAVRCEDAERAKGKPRPGVT